MLIRCSEPVVVNFDWIHIREFVKADGILEKNVKQISHKSF